MNPPAAPGPYLSIDPASPRAPALYALFGRIDYIPVTKFTSDIVDLPERPGAAIFTVHTTRLTPGERNNLLRWLIDKHAFSRAQAEKYLEDPGVIIYAEDCRILDTRRAVAL